MANSIEVDYQELAELSRRLEQAARIVAHPEPAATKVDTAALASDAVSTALNSAVTFRGMFSRGIGENLDNLARGVDSASGQIQDVDSELWVLEE